MDFHERETKETNELYKQKTEREVNKEEKY